MAIGPNPEFAWSVSRANMFSFCPRKYYHRYYGMWGGWKDDASEKRRLTYLLSRRTSLAGWVGQEVHRAVASFLSADVPMDHILNECRQRMRGQFRQSRSRQFLRPGQAKSFGLTEHFYDVDLSDQEVRARWEQVESCLRSFAQAPYRKDLRQAQDAGRLCYVESPEQGDFSAMGLDKHELGDFRIYAHPDFVIGYPDDSVCILDWKTGQPPQQGEDRVTDQLGFYALWTREKLGLDLDRPDLRLDAYEVYLPNEESRGDRMTADNLAAALTFAQHSVAEMRDRLLDPHENVAQESDFEAQGSEAKCALCEFRAVCDDRVETSESP